MVVAKTLEAQNHLVAQLQARSVSRQYIALIVGECPLKGVIHKAIGRDPNNRKKMAIVSEASGKEAITHFTRIAGLGALSLVRLKLETGRTHQIRVHMASMNYPLVGDQVYGKKISKKESLDLLAVEAGDVEFIQAFPRQALHAQSLSLIHPATGDECTWSAPIPEDMSRLICVSGGERYVQ
jgi:23S rRNA pseudouridine1911/1915/1917 synthase